MAASALDIALARTRRHQGPVCAVSQWPAAAQRDFRTALAKPRSGDERVTNQQIMQAMTALHKVVLSPSAVRSHRNDECLTCRWQREGRRG
jgi:hypothetical protein